MTFTREQIEELKRFLAARKIQCNDHIFTPGVRLL